MKKGKRTPFGTILLLLAAWLAGPASADELAGASVKCLQCHGQQGIAIRFESGETVEAHVNPDKFRLSAHKALTCSHCHTDFSQDSHPKRRFKSRDQYRARLSGICRSCHTAEQLRERPVHSGLLKKEEAGAIAVCTECHEAHAVAAVSGGKSFAGEKQYCMSCHQYELSLGCRNGEKIPLHVDLSGLESTAHAQIRCSDCHYGFSAEEHPKRKFKSRRDYTIASSESCRRCHFDKYTKTLDSVHYSLLSHGNLSAPVCIDCHGSHAIPRISHGIKGRTVTTQKCRQCHAGIYEVYARSVHGKALFNEQNQDVPICIDCHTAHDIKNPLTLDYHERIPQMCGNCHANPAVAGKYGLSTDVLKTYLSDFHGVTLGFYKKQREQLYKPARPIAVCTDCHGTHSIASTTSSDSAVKANLVRRCQKCHRDASANFPNAWLFHYKPSLAKFPLVYLVDRAYRIFIPLMVAGLVLQILLHIWRYAVNR